MASFGAPMPCDLPTNHGHRQLAKGDTNTKNAGHEERDHEGVMKRRKTTSTKASTNALAAQTSNRQQQATATSTMRDAQILFRTNPFQNNNSNSNHGPQFLQVHLQILKTLYSTGNDVDADELQQQQQQPSPPPKDEDDTVEDEQWVSIQNFLQVRDDVIAMSHQVQRVTGIHQEALLFQGQMMQVLDAAAAAATAATDQVELREEKKKTQEGSPSKRNALPKMTTTTKGVQKQKNPVLVMDLSTLVTPKKSGGRQKKVSFSASAQKKKKSRSRSIMDDVGVNSKMNGKAELSPPKKEPDYDRDQPFPPIHTMYNTCGIVSTLLKRKHHCVSRHWKKQMQPYQALAVNIATRMSVLKTKLDSIEESSMKTTTAAAAAAAQESRVRMETKVQLWRMLHQDLIAAGTGY